MQRQLLEFRLAGVDKDDATREKLHKLQDRLTEDQSMFDRNISDGQQSVEVSDVSELDGLPQDYIDHHKPGADGKIHITTDYPDLFPALDFAKSESLRRRLWEAFVTRAYPKNREVLLDMMRMRYEIATLIGYSSWADYSAADKMIVNGKNIAKFIDDLDATTRSGAQREYAILLAEKRKTDPSVKEVFGFDSSSTFPSWCGAPITTLIRKAFDLTFHSTKSRKGSWTRPLTLFHVSFSQELNAPGGSLGGDMGCD